MKRFNLLGTAFCLLLAVSCGSGGGAALATSLPSPPTAIASPSPTVSPSLAPSPAPSPPPDYGAPPSGVDLLYLIVPGLPSWLVGYDWQGHPRATVHLKELDGHADPSGAGIIVAPSGNGFAYGGAYTFDRLGHVVYSQPPGGKGDLITTWSEDGQLLCGVQEISSAIDSNGNGTTDYYFERRTPTSAGVRVAHFLHLDAIPGDMGYSVFACSHRLDRALLVRTVCCGISGVVVMRISDGAILGTWNRDAGQPVFSPDGQEVADPTMTADGKSVASTEVRLLLGGTVLARYGPGISFVGFADGNRLAVVSVAVGGGTRTEVIEVATRRVIWQDPSNRALSRVWPRPGTSGDLALAFTASPAQVPCPGSPGSDCPNPLSNIVIVHADGSAAGLAGDVIVPMGWG